jgi:SAM-dependent methyltransferase
MPLIAEPREKHQSALQLALNPRQTMAPEPIHRLCPVCAGADHSPYLEKAGLSLVRCNNCGMIFATPVCADLASGAYYDQAAAAYYLSPEKLESDYAEVRYQRELRIFRTFVKSGKVLDVGCSSGGFLHNLSKRFPGDYEMIGVDASGPALDYAESRGVTVRRGSFLEMDFPTASFRAITFWAVLEHLAEPVRYLEKAASILAPGGHCIVLVPNMDSLAVRFLGSRYRYIYPEHLNYFTRDTLRKIAGKRFEVLRIQSMHFNPIVVWQDWRRGGKDVPQQDRSQLLKRTTGYKQSPWLTPARWLYNAAEKTLGAMNLADNIAMVLRLP